jgi:hypothetical protein
MKTHESAMLDHSCDNEHRTKFVGGISWSRLIIVAPELLPNAGLHQEESTWQHKRLIIAKFRRSVRSQGYLKVENRGNDLLLKV